MRDDHRPYEPTFLDRASELLEGISKSAVGVAESHKSPKPIIYIATPYSHHCPEVMRLRADMVTEYCARQTRLGYVVFSPITHSHELAKYGTPTDWGFWSQIDETFLRVCDFFVYLDVPGTDKSVGVNAEIALCNKLGIQVYRSTWDEDLDTVLPATVVLSAKVRVH
jgi:hypothetical protein